MPKGPLVWSTVKKSKLKRPIRLKQTNTATDTIEKYFPGALSQCQVKLAARSPSAVRPTDNNDKNVKTGESKKNAFVEYKTDIIAHAENESPKENNPVL